MPRGRARADAAVRAKRPKYSVERCEPAAAPRKIKTPACKRAGVHWSSTGRGWGRLRARSTRSTVLPYPDGPNYNLVMAIDKASQGRTLAVDS